MALPPRGNRMPSHRIHTYCVCSPTDFHSSGGILPPPQQRVSHRIRRSHRSLCWEYSPTESTELTELLAEFILPQISQNSQKFLLSVFSHRFHRFAQMVRVPSRGCTCLRSALPLARARSAPTELRWCTSCYVGALETSAPPEVSSFCVDLCNLWEALCCCGGKDTSATIFRTQTICVDLLSMLISKCFDHYFHFKLRFYIQGWMFCDF